MSTSRPSTGPCATRNSPPPIKSLSAFRSGEKFGSDLGYLLELVAEGQLAVDIGWRGSWGRFDDAVAGLLGREFAGKAVLDHD